MGKKSRAQGSAFEARVRLDLENNGYIVDKWTNNVKENKLVPAKAKWNNFTKSMMMGSGGFPDFIAFKKRGCSLCYARMSIVTNDNYNVIGVESKMNGTLDKLEKEKCRWLLDNRIFSQILIAEKTKVKNKVVIKYHDFKKKYE